MLISRRDITGITQSGGLTSGRAYNRDFTVGHREFTNVE